MRKAFTLVELVVVITVLGILSTIGYVSYVGYAQDSRDGVRISNLNDIKKSLELKKTKSGDYPVPDQAYSVKYLGKEVWKQGIIGSKTKKHIKFSSVEMDPKYEADYSYSVSSNGKRFEVGTIMEDESNNPSSFLVGNTYANLDDKALNLGNLRGKFHVTKVNGETHVFSIPSMIFRESSDLNVVVDQPTTKFSVSGEGALPETYVGKSEANEAVSFTPRLLYRGANCGVETDQEIVNFLASLRDSFNYEPFISNPDYKDIFEDYETLRNNMDDFDTLKKLGLKINKLLDCNIKSFKTVDIFPTQCGYEGLQFEGVEDGYDIATQSCLYDYKGEGVATVQSNIGVSNTQGLLIDPTHGTGEFSYRVFTYTPMKFHFDYLPNFSSSSNFKFFINDVEYKYMNRSSTDYDNVTFKEFETPLLKPGLYDFKWVVYKYGSHGHRGEIILDELEFTCIGGGNGCGWTDNEFEVGPINPWDIFEFSGAITSTWEQVDRGNGTLAIKSPIISLGSEAFLTKSVTLDEPAKIEFDMMMNLTHGGEIKFYIDDILYLYRGGTGYSGSEYEDVYAPYTTPLMPAGTYELKWSVDINTYYTAQLWLDQIRFKCVGGADVSGNEGCGWEDTTFENGNINPWDMFDFTGIQKSYHWLQYDRDGSNTAIQRLEIPERGTSSFETEITLATPAKINFELFTYIGHSSTIKFYIDDNLMLNVGRNSLDYKDDFELYTSELLEAGTYQLKWEIYQSYGEFKMGFDNFHLTCEGGTAVAGNEECGWADETLNPGNLDPWDNMTVVGTLEQYEWIQTDLGNGNHAIINNTLGNNEKAGLEKIIVLNDPAKINFNLKYDLPYGSRYIFSINDEIMEEFIAPSGGIYTDYTQYSTQMLPAGVYTLKWEAKNYYGNAAYIGLQDIIINCINGGVNCGWDDETFDNGDEYPWTNYTFSGGLKSYQWYQKDDNSGNNIIVHTKLLGNEVSSISKKFVLTDSAKIDFDVKTEFISNSQMRFYINNDLIYTHFGDNSEFEDVMTNYTTTLLDAGIYDFKIEIEGDYRSNIELDNFRVSCEGGGGNCGINLNTLGEGSMEPWIGFNHSGDLKSYQWMHANNGDGTKSLTNAPIPSNGSTELETTISLGASGQISFDLKTDLYVHSDVKFYVDGILQLDVDGYNDSLYDNQFETFTTSDTFGVGTHTLRWELDRYYDAVNHIWIKNITHN